MPAPAQSPWSLIDPNKLAQIGVHAVTSGKVSLGEAHQNAQDMGLLQPNSLAMSNQSPTGPFDMNAGVPPSKATQGTLSASDALSHVKNAYAKNEQDNSTKRMRSMNRLLTKTPDQIQAELLMAQGRMPKITGYKPAVDENGLPLPGGYTDESQPIYDLADAPEDPNHPVVQQRQGLDKMQEMLGMEVEANAKRPTMDFTPLSALADAVNAQNGRPTNLAASAVRPANNTGEIMKQADEIQKRRADIQKAIYENQKNMKGGSALDQLTQMMMMKDTAGFGGPAQGTMQARLEQAQWNRAHIAHDALMRRISTDIPARQELQGFNTLSNALALIQNTDNLTPQQSVEAQRKIMQAMSLSGNGSTIGDERAQMYLKDIGQDADRFMQWLEGKPVNISKNDPLITHIKNMALIEQENLRNQRSARIDALVPGSSWIYDDNKWPDLNKSFDKALAATKAETSRLGPTFTNAASRGAKATGQYDGSGPLPSGFTDSMKQKRLEYLQRKQGGN